MKTNIQFWSYLTQFFLEWEMFSDKSCGENQNTHFMLNNFFFSKILPFMRQRGKMPHSGAGHRWQYGTCSLHAGYLTIKHTFIICNIFALPLQRNLHEHASLLRYTYSTFFSWFIPVVCELQISIDKVGKSKHNKTLLTLWRRIILLNFSTPCI
jgi:hypothetical protein